MNLGLIAQIHSIGLWPTCPNLILILGPSLKPAEKKMAFGPVNKGGAEGPWPNPEKESQSIHKCIHAVYSIYLTHLDLSSPAPI